MDNIQFPQQNVFEFDHISNENTHKIKFNSVFDSGNLREVLCPSYGTYIIHTAPDCCGTKFEGNTRSWFYFGVSGVPTGTTINFIIKRISILYSMFRSAAEAYKPVYKVTETGEWKRVEGITQLLESEEKTLDVKFSFTFESSENEVFFAFSYPFSYKENVDLLEKYDRIYPKDTDLYYHRELLIRSPHERDVDLVTISSHEGKLNENESTMDENLFPNLSQQPRARKFRTNKPVILITARVHPGETPASHTMNGIFEFILDKKDVRAQMLRNYFVFMFVPMINPDGVAMGHYRMDVFHQNLNRYYKNPDIKKQPAIFGIKKLVEYLNSENRLFFYCDLHAHAAKKGCFLYGNALDFVMQVETILFAKVMSLNCINFEYESCNFSQKHMNARDRNEKLTKEGAGRVCVYRLCNLIHSYTLECGLHFSNELNRIPTPSSNKEWYENEVSDINSDMYKESPTYYTIKIYENLGKSMLVSILDIFEKNPCTRVGMIAGETLENFRKEIASKVIKIRRFWKEAHVKRKCRTINETVKEIFYDEFFKKNVFNHMYVAETRLHTSARKLSAIGQIPSTAKSVKKSSPVSNRNAKTTKETNLAMFKFDCDENFNEEDEEEDFDDDMPNEQKPLPKLKTALVPKEFRLRQADRFPQLEKLLKEELLLAGSSDKKSFSQGIQSMKVSEKMVLHTSEFNTNADIFTPNRTQTGFVFKEGKIQQVNYVESGKFPKRPLMYKEPKLEKKNSNPLKLPDLDGGNTDVQFGANPFFVVVGGKNYMAPKNKSKSGVSSLRKVK